MEQVGSIGRVLVSPDNPNRVYVAAMGTLFANNPERGVYRTDDGRLNWEQILFVSDSTGAVDLVMHPAQPMVLFAAFWERIRRPDRRSYTGVSSGIYKSTDGGDTWQELTNGLPSLPSDKGRISLAVAPSDPNRIYAAYVNEQGRIGHVLTSGNAGLSWSAMSLLNLETTSFDWWFNRLVVSPEDPMKIYYIGFNINEYNSSTQSWTQQFLGAHVDQHALWINPSNANHQILGNDGGLYLTGDGGATFTKWDNLPITQFYTCEIDNLQPYRRYGGSQDNGTNRTLTGLTNDWQPIFGGDGFRVLVDPTDNTYVYAEYQYGNVGRSVDGGQSFVLAINGLETARRNWNTPFVFDPVVPSTLYLGGQRVYQSTNRAQSWQSISPDLSLGANGSNGLVYGTITTLSVSPIDNQIIWAGTDNGHVWRTTNGGQNWLRVSEALPMRWVTSVTADPALASGAYITYSGYRYGTNMSHIYYTNDLGNTWEDLNGNLPDIPVNDLVVDDAGVLFLATDVGVYYDDTQQGNWQPLGLGLPPVIVTDLAWHAGTHTLVAATYGRSMWSINTDVDVAIEEEASLSHSWYVFPNPTQRQGMIRMNLPSLSRCRITLYDSNGKIVKTLFDGTMQDNEFTIQHDFSGLPAGVYYVQLEQAGKVDTRKWVVNH
ncbi:MAG: T9SS type A sorting domain-containing protein [Saprospiraceae bacterium]